MLREKFKEEPPKQHDVGWLLIEYQDRLPEEVHREVQRLAAISKWLRKEREFAFYGDIDFIPTLEYSQEDGESPVRCLFCGRSCRKDGSFSMVR